MWQIQIRYRESDTWEPIWSGDGADTERDARDRFGRIQRRIDGDVSGLENRNADGWEMVRMLQSGDLVAEHRSGGPPDPFTVATKPSRPPRNE